jgi:23S rRNA (guanosine2251-2'-O)-methyltransferase
MRKLIIIAHDIRSTHNVGSLLRTAEGLGVTAVIFSGYTPYPLSENDDRLPHLARKINAQITKTALGAELLVSWKRSSDIEATISMLKGEGYQVVALEQTSDSIALPDFVPPDKLVILLGREVEGIEPRLIACCDQTIEIPMFGKKESFNVVQAAAMMLYHARFAGKS